MFSWFKKKRKSEDTSEDPHQARVERARERMRENNEKARKAREKYSRGVNPRVEALTGSQQADNTQVHILAALAADGGGRSAKAASEKSHSGADASSPSSSDSAASSYDSSSASSYDSGSYSGGFDGGGGSF
jgi:outer membrane biosynthesis protein TonB